MATVMRCLAAASMATGIMCIAHGSAVAANSEKTIAITKICTQVRASKGGTGIPISNFLFIAGGTAVIECAGIGDQPWYQVGWNVSGNTVSWANDVGTSVTNTARLRDFYVVSRQTHQAASGLTPESSRLFISAYDLTNGRKLWEQTPDKSFAFAYGGPAGSNVVLASESGVRAFDKAGRVVWQAPPVSIGAVTIVDNGSLVGLSDKDFVSTFYDVTTGKKTFISKGVEYTDARSIGARMRNDTFVNLRTGATTQGYDRTFRDGMLRNTKSSLSFVTSAGVTRWSIPAGVIQQWDVFGDRLYVENKSSQVIEVDPSNGRERTYVPGLPRGGSTQWLVFVDGDIGRFVPNR